MLEPALHADVVLFHWQLVAHAAAVAVVAGLTAANFADAALVAVVNLFLDELVIVKRAYGAVIATELDIAACADGRFGLDELAAEAFDVGHVMPVDSMVLPNVKHIVVHGLIVTEATRVGLALADRVRALQLAPAQVVLAPELAFLEDQLTRVQLLVV